MYIHNDIYGIKVMLPERNTLQRSTPMKCRIHDDAHDSQQQQRQRFWIFAVSFFPTKRSRSTIYTNEYLYDNFK